MKSQQVRLHVGMVMGVIGGGEVRGKKFIGKVEGGKGNI